MSTSKPVEWVSALIERFEDQVLFILMIILSNKTEFLVTN